MNQEKSLLNRTVSSGRWLVGYKIINYPLIFLRTVILARLLAPNDFGLMGIALLAISTLETFSQTGFERALIQKKEDIRLDLDTAWTISIFRGMILFIFLFISAPWMASFFNDMRAIPIIKITAALFLLKGFSNIGIVYFKKEIEFRKQVTLQLVGSISEAVVTIILAFILKNIWALVFGLLFSNSIQLIITYIMHPFRPKLKFELGKARQLFLFGRWIFCTTILVFIITNGPKALVGRALGVTTLGFYIMAYRLSNLPTTEIAHTISQVVFPAYSKLQTNLDKVKGAYLRVLQLVIFISVPLAGGIFIMAPEFTKIFLGDKWIPIIGVLRLLCIVGVLRSVQNTYGVFAGIGKPEIETKIGVLTFGFMVLTIYPMTLKYGIMGTAMAVAISLFFSTCYGAWQVHHILDLNYSNFSKVILLPILSVVVFSLFIISIQTFLPYSINILSFFGLLVSSIVVYLGSIFLLDRLFNYGLRGLSLLLLRAF